MRIEVTSVRSDASGAALARFRSALGTAEGVWAAGVPVAGEEYEVELDIPRPIVWGRDLTPCLGCDEMLSSTGHETVLQGRVEAIENDGVVAFRVNGSLVLIDTDGAIPPDTTQVRLVTDMLLLHDART